MMDAPVHFTKNIWKSKITGRNTKSIQEQTRRYVGGFPNNHPEQGTGHNDSTKYTGPGDQK